MQSTGSMALQPLRTVVVRMMLLEADCLRPVAGPSLGAKVTMKAVQVEGLSDLVRVVSYHTCKRNSCVRLCCSEIGICAPYNDAAQEKACLLISLATT